MDGMRFVERDFQGHRWGYGTLTNVDLNQFTGTRLKIEVQKLGRSAGCPIPEATIRRKGLLGTGIDYQNDNKIYTATLALLQSTNFGLKVAIHQDVRRLPDEEVGIFEQDAVPASHIHELAPRARVFGWAEPRLVKMAAEKVGDEVPDFHSLEADLLEINRTSPTPHIWLVRIAEMAMKKGVEAPLVLGRLLSRDYFREENTFTDFADIAEAASLYARDLWAEHKRLSSAEQDAYNIEPFDA